MRIHLSKTIVSTFLIGSLFGVAVTTVGAAMKGSAAFRDIPSGSYYDDAVGEMYALGIIQGIDTKQGKVFQPEKPLTRADAAVLFKRLRDEIKGIAYNPPPSSVASSVRTISSSRSSSVSSSIVSSSSSVSSVYNPAGTVRFATAFYTVMENASSMKITVVRTGGNQGAVTVKYSASGGTAVANTDYKPVSGTLTFSGMETSKTFEIPITDNAVTNSNKTVTITLSGVTGGSLGNPSTSILTIIDNETSSDGAVSSSSVGSVTFPNPTTAVLGFSASTYSAVEGIGSLTVTVVRSGVQASAVSVGYSVTDGTAKAGSDFGSVSGTLNFAANETSKTFTIPVMSDTIVQGNRSAILQLSNPSAGASLGTPSTASLIVVDKDMSSFVSGTGSVKFTSSTFDVNDSQQYAVITIMHVGGYDPVSVTFSTNGGLAKAGQDFQSVSTTVQFAKGESTKVILIPIGAGSPTLSDRTVLLQLTAVSNGLQITDPYSATLTIHKS